MVNIDYDIYNHSSNGDVTKLLTLLRVSSTVSTLSSLYKGSIGKTALHRLSQRNHIECLRVILPYTMIHIDAKDEDGNTPLMDACISNNVECASLLLDNDANVNATNENGDTSLILAIVNHSFDCVKLLIKRGAHVNVKNNNGMTPLKFATKLGFYDCISLFLDFGELQIKEREIKYHLPQCREIIVKKRAAFDTIINTNIHYEPWKNEIYSKCFSKDSNLIPTMGWPRALEIYKKFYHEEVLFLIHLHLVQVYNGNSTNGTDLIVKQFAKNSNKTSLLMTLLSRFITEYL